MKQSHLIAAAAAAAVVVVVVVDIANLLYTRNFHYSLHKSSPQDTVLCQLSRVNIFRSYLILFSIYCRTVNWQFLFKILHYNSVHISCLPCVLQAHFFTTFRTFDISRVLVFFSLHVREKLPVVSQISLTFCKHMR
jgi:hypothetical protein